MFTRHNDYIYHGEVCTCTQHILILFLFISLPFPSLPPSLIPFPMHKTSISIFFCSLLCFNHFPTFLLHLLFTFPLKNHLPISYGLLFCSSCIGFLLWCLNSYVHCISLSVVVSRYPFTYKCLLYSTSNKHCYSLYLDVPQRLLSS